MYSPPRLKLRRATRLGHCTPELAALVRKQRHSRCRCAGCALRRHPPPKPMRPRHRPRLLRPRCSGMWLRHLTVSCAGSTNSTIRGMPMRRVTSSGASTSGAMCAGYLPRPTLSCKHSVCGAMRAFTATLGSGSKRGHVARRPPRSTWQRFGARSAACAHDRSGPNQASTALLYGFVFIGYPTLSL